jgi:hypothetical protein
MKIAHKNQTEDNAGKEIKIPRRGGQTLVFKTPVVMERDARATGLRSCKVNDNSIVLIDTDIIRYGEREVKSRNDIIVTPFDKFDLMAAYDITEKRAANLAVWMNDSFIVKSVES